MRAVLAGRAPAGEQYHEYYRVFHAEHLAATERSLRGFLDERGLGTYDRIANLLQLAKDAFVLDVGCGDGELLERIGSRNRTLHLSGIDLAEAEIERARLRLASHRVSALIVGDACATPFTDRAFDAVVSHMTVMLVPDLAALFAEVRRLLREGGQFAFLVPRPGDPGEPAAQLMRAIPGWVREVHAEFTPVNPGDTRALSTAALQELLASAGYPKVEVDDFTVERLVPAAELPSLLQERYYVGSLPPGASALLSKRVLEWAGNEPVLYREPMRVVSAR